MCAVLCVCWRFHVLIGSTGVICEEKIAKRIEMEDNISDESKKTSTHTYTGTWYLVLRIIPGGALCVLKKA